MLHKTLINQLKAMSLTDFQSWVQKLQPGEEQRQAVRHRCATDLELFSQLFFPHYCTRAFNEFHRDFFEDCVFGERRVRRVRAAPRGAAKSTLTTLIKCIHDACYGLEQFVLILSSTTPLANKKLKDIRAEILSNADLRAFYGVKFPTKKAGEAEFVVLSEEGRTYFAAVGRGSEVRGIRYGSARPTKIICDDVEFSEEVYNEKTRKKTEDWFFEDVGKVGDTETSIEFIGTVLHRDSLLSKLLNNPAYQARIYRSVISWSEREDLWQKWRDIYRDINNPNRLADSHAFYQANESELLRGTQVLWPEKETYLDHMMDMEEIGRRAFMKEKQNEPQGSDEPVFEKIHWYRETSEGLLIESSQELIKWDQLRGKAIGAMDPATGKVKPSGGKLGDFTVIATAYKEPKGRVLVHADFTKRVAPTRYIQELFELHTKYDYASFAVETNLYRNLLLPNIMDEKKRREAQSKKAIRIPFYDVEQTENKAERIYRLEPKVNHGWILFNRALSKEFMNQIVDFPHADHDDSPDCVEILWNLAHNRYRPAVVSVAAMSGY
jgi:predicted phage terminase large subunit-like protein